MRCELGEHDRTGSRSGGWMDGKFYDDHGNPKKDDENRKICRFSEAENEV